MKTLFLFIGLLLLTGCTIPGATETGGTTDRIPVEVTQVIDGDTVRVIYEGKETTVRYLLVDTPETNHPRFGEQPLGPEATERNREILKTADHVEIEFDVGGRFDDYDRLLGYFYADGDSVQEQLVAEGFARVAYIYPPNTRYVDEFREAEATAKQAEIGIWQFDNYATDRGFNPDAYQPDNAPATQDCRIKGNINRSGDKIFHMPGTPSYEQTNPEQWFCTEQQARDAGFRSAGQ
ncbi:thermonuclease family protein [Planococcus sp. ISL-109]|uniref:thermonuclease family protein n=1 Tax=Planococcus sp. ISL-109 TaxID=2819166 RepID=UPI001BEC9011|nr:thermonuclease family protein [Planococcus sp. ISL-109]MBT2581761.1 thermonuclease family protein [Planococcus sp. ISL-109]